MSDYFLRTLYVHTPGTRLVLEGDAVRALREDAPPRRLPLNAIDTIVVAGGIDVSTPLLLRCAEDGRLVAFVGRSGRPRAIVEGPFDGRGQLRRAQYRAAFDEGRRLEMGRAIVVGKIDQMSWGLRQWARDIDPESADRLRSIASDVESLRTSASAALSREEAMGLEGAASRAYFKGLGIALRDRQWPGRRRHPSVDPINATLSFLYGMARVAVHGAIQVAALDPYCGFLHGDADRQPALVLDLLEEFRPSTDRLVVSLFNKHQLRDAHFEYDLLKSCRLSDEGREIVLNAWHQHRMTKARIRGSAGAIPRAALPFVQAYAMANALRGGGAYQPHRLPIS